MSSNSKAAVDVIHAETDNNGAINSAIKVTEQWFEQNNWTVLTFRNRPGKPGIEVNPVLFTRRPAVEKRLRRGSDRCRPR